MPKKPIAEIVTPKPEPHDDPDRVIGRRVTFHGEKEHQYLLSYELMIVAVLKKKPGEDEYQPLTTEDKVHAAGGVTADDRIEVVPFLKETGRYSFVTSDPRAIDLDAFRHLARGGTTH
jgi:hypothetical protein